MLAYVLTSLLCAANPHAPTFDADGYPITRSDRIFPASDLKVGLHGVGYTVFQGDRVEPFGVEIIGVLEGMLGPGYDVILARLSGEKIEHTGVISGMSGSPVFIDGRLVGAVSYRFGSFPKDPIAGITPIASMMAVFGEEVAAPAQASVAAPKTPQTHHLWRGKAAGLPTPSPWRFQGGTGVTAIQTPITLSGFAPHVSAELGQRLSTAGFVVHAGGSTKTGLATIAKNQSSVSGIVPAAPIAPGTPIAALLMRGDLNAAGTGTVTMVEDGRVLGFGHPFFGSGHVAFPMATASILHTNASQAGSYKQSSPALSVGAIVHDRLTAIAGRFDRDGAMVPVEISVRAHGFVRPPTRVEITSDPQWLPNLLESAIRTAAARHLGYEAGGTCVFSAEIRLNGQTLRFQDAYAKPAPTDIAREMASDVAMSVRALAQNGLQTADFESIKVALELETAVRLAWVTGLAGPALAEPGETIELQAELRSYRGVQRSVTLKMKLPNDIEGDIELWVGSALDMDRRDHGLQSRVPTDLADLIKLNGDRRDSLGLYAQIYQKQAGYKSGMGVLPRLPESMRLTLGRVKNARVGKITHAMGPGIRVAQNDVVLGHRTLKLKVRR